MSVAEQQRRPGAVKPYRKPPYLVRVHLQRVEVDGPVVKAVAQPALQAVLPESLQTRFETIVNPDVGPANAKESGEGRIIGFYDGLDLWERFPLSGAGPGAWRIATGRKIEAHNLYGQLLGELGTVGAVAFLFMLSALFVNYRKLGRLIRAQSPDPKADPTYHLMQAMVLSTLLLLFEGMFGHNLYRYNWVWYCAFTSVALAALRERSAAPDTDVYSPARTDGWAYLT